MLLQVKTRFLYTFDALVRTKTLKTKKSVYKPKLNLAGDQFELESSEPEP